MSKTPKYIIKDLKPSEKEDLNRFGAITDIKIWNERPAFKDVNKFFIFLKKWFYHWYIYNIYFIVILL